MVMLTTIELERTPEVVAVSGVCWGSFPRNPQDKLGGAGGLHPLEKKKARLGNEP
ncbi:MAG: hypothetical protein HWN68_20175 [Desulfobacterales bacterium]|nr:hypothetical protein [Desulfobacterales bacterium]